MLLQDEVANTLAGPVRAKACAPFHIEDFHSVADSRDNCFLRCLKGVVELSRPSEFVPGAEKGFKWGHSVAKLGIVSDLVDKPEPTTDVGGGGWGREVSITPSPRLLLILPLYN